MLTALLGPTLGGCVALPRDAPPPTIHADVAPVGFPSNVRFVSTDATFFDAHLDGVVERLTRVAQARPLNVIAFSGGGAGGAFGAGVLEGLGGRASRPSFDLVTGVSVGALIAPFAFLGPEWDRELEDAFLGGHSAHLMQRRLGSVLFRPSLYRGEPLVALVDRFVTARLVEAVAREARTGRQLLVATTNIDTQETVIWDLGAIAMQGGEPARRLFRDVLVASSSIPGIFPPVSIRVGGPAGAYEEFHVDGGTSVPFFVASEIAQIRARRLHALAGARLYVVINGQLLGRPGTTVARITSVVSRSFATEQTHGARRTLELTDAFARANGMTLQFTSIPATYRYLGPLSFSPDAMRALFAYGAGCSASGRIWVTLDEAAADAQRLAATVTGEASECPRPATAAPGPTLAPTESVVAVAAP